MKQLVVKGLDALARAALTLALISLLGMAAVEFWQVIARYLLNDSPSWTEPVALLLMALATMLGAAVGVRRDAHFAFSAIAQSLPSRLGSMLALLSRLIVILIGVMLAAGGAHMVADAWDVTAPGTVLPLGINYLPLCLGGALIALFGAERLLLPLPDAAAANPER